MIIRTTSPDQLRVVIAGLKKRGFSRVESTVQPDWKDDAYNHIEIDTDFMLWSLIPWPNWSFTWDEFLVQNKHKKQ